jgi:abhydrolase domain-containing protein 12
MVWPVGSSNRIDAKSDSDTRLAGKTLNIKIQTSDNVTLGAWFTFAEDYYQNAASLDPTSDTALGEADVAHALRSHHTILYFHGNAASRAAPHRVRFYSQWTSRVRANVLAIDYRGFGDSEGSPSEAGLRLDGRAAWDWLVRRGARPNNILLFGQSLGTGVVAQVAHQLSIEGAPINSVDIRISALLRDTTKRGCVFRCLYRPSNPIANIQYWRCYSIATALPIDPVLLQYVTGLIAAFHQGLTHYDTGALDAILIHKFSTISILPEVTCPILLIHGENDFDIQVKHSQRLFDEVLEPYLEQYPYSQKDMAKVHLENEEQRRIVDEVSARRRQKRDELVKHSTIQGLGTISRFKREDKGDVTLLRSTWGGHDRIINYEGVMDVTRKIFEL